MRGNAEAPEGTAAPEAPEMNEKDEEFGPSYKNEKRLESTTKIVSVKLAKKSKNTSGKTKTEKT